MKKAILARKIGMTQVFSKNGELIPVTVLEAGPCVVVQKKTIENEGYCAIQIGFKDARINSRGNATISKPKAGHFEKAGVAYKKYLREFRLLDANSYEVGQDIFADIFNIGDHVDISGISKGKGFQGSIKRHNQSRGPMSHGSKYHRGTGSLSSGTTPGRVKKGKKLPGHMGNIRVTIQNLEIVQSDKEKNLILVKGAVPGPRGAILEIKNTTRPEKASK